MDEDVREVAGSRCAPVARILFSTTLPNFNSRPPCPQIPFADKIASCLLENRFMGTRERAVIPSEVAGDFFLPRSSGRPATPGVGCSCSPSEQERNLSSVFRKTGCPILVHVCSQIRSQVHLE